MNQIPGRKCSLVGFVNLIQDLGLLKIDGGQLTDFPVDLIELKVLTVCPVKASTSAYSCMSVGSSLMNTATFTDCGK